MNGVGRDIVPESKTRKLFEFRYMLLEREFGKRLMKKLPVAAMEREYMVVYLARNPELVMQHPRLLRAIKLEFKGLHAVQFLFRCVSAYR